MAKIKICGLFREQDVKFVNRSKPDFIGFVFSEKSKRFVSLEQAVNLRKDLSEDIVPVGVFVNAKIDFICELYKNGIIEMAQLHGYESDEYILKLKSKCDIPIIRATTVDKKKQMGIISASDYILLDNSVPGSGEIFDWERLQGIDLSENIFLAGGISLENIKEAIKLNPFAIDLSSGAETNGFKDEEKIQKLVEAVSLPKVKDLEYGRTWGLGFGI